MGEHEGLEIYGEAHNAKISLLESCEIWAADVTSIDVILEKWLPYKHSGNTIHNNMIAEYNNIVNGTTAEKENIIAFIIAGARN